MAEKKIPTMWEAREAFYIGGAFVPKGKILLSGHPHLKGRTKLFTKFEPEGAEPEPAPEPEPEPEPEKADN
jgi:hypothetical protein